jgi:hypothetical protein
VPTTRRLLAALACAAACSASHADRSRLDDEDVAERGDCEIELAAERQTARRAATERETALQLDCGIGWRTELKAALARQRSPGERTDSFDLEARTALFDRAVAGVAWSIAYGASAERSAGGPWRRSAHFLALEGALRPAEAWVVEAEVAWRRDRIDRREAWVWTLGVEHEISDLLEVRAELEDDNRSRPLAGIELRYEFWPDRARLNLSYAARSGPSRERKLGLGVTFEF